MKRHGSPPSNPPADAKSAPASESAIRNPQSAIGESAGRNLPLGHDLLTFDSLPSTNDLAREMAQRGAVEGVAILALEQTSGRGRQGRIWCSPPGDGLYLSVILRPPMEPAKATILTLAAAVAAAETLSIDYDLAVDIKWPNDIHAGGRKICGILVESAVEKGRLEYAVLGIGVNLRQRDFPEDLRETATSFVIQSGLDASSAPAPEEFAAPLLSRLESWYRVCLRDPAAVLDRWQALSSYATGCAVRIESAESIIEGITSGLAPSGALLLRLPNGETREIFAGELSLRKA